MDRKDTITIGIIFLFILMSPNTAIADSWAAPLGIPHPEFGIEEDYLTYNEASNRNPDLTYNQNDEEGYYTHYVDKSDPNCVNSGFGSPSEPLCYLPSAVPAGSIVEVHGNYDVAEESIEGNGNANMPVFIRGLEAERPFFSSRLGVGGAYVIAENLEFGDADGNLDGGASGGVFPNGGEYISIRNCEVSGNKAQMYTAGIGLWDVSNVVIYDNLVHNMGDVDGSGDQDAQGIIIASDTTDVWIVDNIMHHNSGDGIQINAGNNADSATRDSLNHIYVGRNTAYSNKQTGFWVKNAADVIFSENEAYDHHPSDSSNGAGIGYQYDPLRVWFIFNKVHDNTYGLSPGSYNKGTGDEIYFIGNLFYNNDNAGIRMNDGAGKEYLISNTIYNNPIGIENGYYQSKLEIANNIIAGVDSYHIRFEEYLTGSVSNIQNCLFSEPVNIVWDDYSYSSVSDFQDNENECPGCLSGDPRLVSGSNLGLTQESPAIDAGSSSGIVKQVYDRFEELYGLDIRIDIEGNSRDSSWDIGAYEFGAQTSCSGTDSSCGIFPDCQNCDSDDACSGDFYMDYYCSGTSCAYNTVDCTGCACSCGGYDVPEMFSNSNCEDGIDNDCDGLTDSEENSCQGSDCILSDTTFQNFAVQQKDGRFRIRFDAVPFQDDMDGVVLFSDGQIDSWDDFAFSIRFFTNSQIEAKHTDVYANDIGFNYDAGKEYSFMIIVDVGIDQYDVFVNGSQLAQDYGFKNSEVDVARLDNWALISDIGTFEVCSFSINSCQGYADRDCDGCIADSELFYYIGQWRDGQVLIEDLMDAMVHWRRGC